MKLTFAHKGLIYKEANALLIILFNIKLIIHESI